MKEKFQQIKKEYEEFYNSFLRNGRLPMGETKAGFWGTAATDDIFELFKTIELQKFKSFIDLGSGDGKVVLIASLFTKSAGIEFDEELHAKAVEIKEKLGLNAELMNGDFMEHDLSGYDVIFINPDKPFNKGLERKLRKEMKGTLLVYNMVYKPFSLDKGATHWMGYVPATFYTIK
jgi:hypothetical protein